MSDLRIDQLSYAYPGSNKPILNQINLTIPRGEFVLVAGPSGCGKSTLALALAGLIPTRVPGPMRGNVYLGDKCITAMDIHESSQHIGMVFQNPDNQLVHLDVESEVAFGPENLSFPKEEISGRIKKALTYTNMLSFLKSPIYALSGGQKQRIAISATLAMEPDVLVLDEPTSDLDPLGTQEILEVLRRLNRDKKMTIILIEHKIDEVIPWVDRVLLMDEGRVVRDESPKTIFKDENHWERLGVTIPETARLSHRFPALFSGQTALTVEDAYLALKGTSIQKQLIDHSKAFSHTIPLDPHSPAESLLEWDQVGLSFSDHHVLKKANLSLHKGDWVALAGPNGSGKTSLASLAMGFQAVTSGQVRFRNEIVKAGRISKQASKIGYLFQAADNMLFSSKVHDELYFGKKHRKKQKNLEFASVENLAKLIDLEAHLDKNPFNLSHGQRKRLGLGALLAAQPEMLILDEPTTGQDEGHAKAFLEFLQNLRTQFQMTYLMITHDMQAAAKYANRLVVLNDGKIILNGPPSHVFAHSNELAEASIIPPPIARLHGLLGDGQSQTVSLDLDSFLTLIDQKGVLV